ncbi:hypothetical protein [Embleya sp. NPDC059237]|uniref:hypothetical protein n=1 Tax=Embleya sp. NPDC059237 TaxID=3346784 RepID=UPI0036C9BD77
MPPNANDAAVIGAVYADLIVALRDAGLHADPISDQAGDGIAISEYALRITTPDGRMPLDRESVSTWLLCARTDPTTAFDGPDTAALLAAVGRMTGDEPGRKPLVVSRGYRRVAARRTPTRP